MDLDEGELSMLIDALGVLSRKGEFAGPPPAEARWLSSISCLRARLNDELFRKITTGEG